MKALKLVALVLASIGVALVLAELALRGLERAQPAPAPPAPDAELAALPELRTLIDLATPNAHGRYLGVPWRTNSAGFRGPEVAPDAAPGTIRVVVLGDSFTAAVGVREEDSYAAQLERLLEAGTGADFEVLNFGLPGLDAASVVERARLLGPRFHPALYVYGYTMNDVFESGEDAGTASPGSAALLGRFLPYMRHSALLRALVPRAFGLWSAFGPASAYTELVIRSHADPALGARLERRFRELGRIARRTRACAHVFVHTDVAALRFGHRFGPSYERVAALARAAGLGASSSYDAFRGRDSARLRLGLFDGHPNAAGHRLLAESLYDGLRGLPNECGLPGLPAREAPE
jgi:lysophospholipase L1-like esterase